MYSVSATHIVRILIAIKIVGDDSRVDRVAAPDTSLSFTFRAHLLGQEAALRLPHMALWRYNSAKKGTI